MNTNNPVIASIDVGTNSFHMVIASVNGKGTMRIITREKEMVRLGSGPGDMKSIKSDAIERGVETLKRFAKIARNEKALVRAVATSAVREAFNKEEFINRVKDECGIDIEVVSGKEEGRLIFIGMMHAVPVYDEETLLIDIGGGSTETVIGKHGEIQYSHSEKLGTIRLTENFFPDYQITKDRIEKARKFVGGNWIPILDKIKSKQAKICVGTSGTIESIAKIALAAKGIPVPEVLNGISLDKKEILSAVNMILSNPTPEERIKIKGLESKRADIIPGGALILEYFINYLDIDKILISPYALREGIVFDTLQKIKDRSEYNHLSRLRFESVISLCKQFNVDMAHAEVVKAYSLKMFDQLLPLHGLNGKERELLEAASYLHDVGYSISHDKHHKHSYYLIMNSDMPGFTNDETELIANIARYHRKSHPKNKHVDFKKFNANKRYLVSLLGGILRIAEGLDRRQLNLIKDIFVEINDIIKIKLTPVNNDVLPEIELWQANQRKKLLEKTLGKDILFTI